MAPRQPRARESTSDDGRDRCVKMRCSLDLDLLDCPICFEYLRAPIYQCKSGHAACEECYKQLVAKKCPSCAQPLGPERSTLLEKVAESVQSACTHSWRGCKEQLPYDPRSRGTHEDECPFRPLRCPVPNCPNMNGADSVVLISDIAAHMVLVHGAELVRYERPDDRTLPGPDDVIRNGFVVSTAKRDFNHARSQYTIVLVGNGDDDPRAAPEPQHGRIFLSPDHPDCRRFLIHHQVDDIKEIHTFSLSGFGTPNHRYRLTVLMQPDKHPPNQEDGRPGHQFKLSCTKDGPVVDNQKPGFSLAKMVRHSEAVEVLKSRGTVYELKFHVTRA